MKNIYNRLPSFSPDYCGASGVFYEMGGLIIMCDPGACTGTILAYDEPRLDLRRSLHSVQIGEKQAVFGIDRELLEKASLVLEEHKRTCVVLLGTPVAATLAVDYKGLAGQLSRKYGIPGFGIDTSSIDTYDVGERKAFDALADYAIRMDAAGEDAHTNHAESGTPEADATHRTGNDESSGKAGHEMPGCEDLINVLGATPMNMWDVNKVNNIIDLLKECGASKVSVWGRNASIRDIGQAGRAKLNIVVAASALSAARKLERRFGTPYVVGFPIGRLAENDWRVRLAEFFDSGTGIPKDREDAARSAADFSPFSRVYFSEAQVIDDSNDTNEAKNTADSVDSGRRNSNACGPNFDTTNSTCAHSRALIVGEQVSAAAIRTCLRKEFGYEDVQVASFFMMDAALIEPGDRHLKDEDGYVAMTTENGTYDLIICDPLMYPLIPYRPARTMPWPHIAVSGRIYTSRCANIFGSKGSDYIGEKIGR